MDEPRRHQKLTYLVEPKLDRRHALALLRDIQELGIERDDVARTNLWSTMTLDDGTVVELSDRWAHEDTVFTPSMRLAATSGIRVPPPSPEDLEARRQAEEMTSNVTQFRQTSSGG